MNTSFNGGIRANPKIIFTQAQQNFLLENHNHLSNKEMAEHLNVSESKIQNWFAENGIKKRVAKSRSVSSEYFFHDTNIATI